LSVASLFEEAMARSHNGSIKFPLALLSRQLHNCYLTALNLSCELPHSRKKLGESIVVIAAFIRASIRKSKNSGSAQQVVQS